MATTRAAPVGSRFWRLVRRAAAVLLVGPALLVLLFRFVPPPITPLVLLRLAQGYPWRQHWVAYHAIAPALVHAVVASEDNLFCTEPLGFDFGALERQTAVLLDGERPRGASTITMQTARNLFLWPGRDYVRKALEAWLTPQIALLWPKQRVMEVYLNIIEFGPGLYGADAAARFYFHKPAAALTEAEATLLASVLPDPLHWSPTHPNPHVREHAAMLERRIPAIRSYLACTQ
jgi:monofunctional biosynthetic peptidoglycan transglycosylase